MKKLVLDDMAAARFQDSWDSFLDASLTNSVFSQIEDPDPLYDLEDRYSVHRHASVLRLQLRQDLEN